MKIDVLITANRSGGQIAEALASVHTQIHADWTVLVVEDGSGNGTERIVRDFETLTQRRVRYERLGREQGMAAVRNRLLELATGETVAFLDPEDTWAPRHLANALQHFNTGADVAVSDMRPMPVKPGRRQIDITVSTQLSANPVRALFTRDVVPSLSSVALRRELATKVGLFDPRFRLGEGRDFLLRCALAGARFSATHRTTCRCGARLEGGKARALLAAEDGVLFYDKHRDLAAVPAALRRRLLAASLVTQGRLLRPQDPSRAARCFWRAWSLQPVHVQTLGQFALTGWRMAATGQESDIDTPQVP